MGHQWLIGMMGSGKTACGTALAEILDIPFIDVDDAISAERGLPVADIFAVDGEAGFRRLERAVIARLADAPPSVIATGGGAALDEDNAASMHRSGRIVLLEASVEELERRLGDGDGRPLLASGDVARRLAVLGAERAATYRAIADVIVDTSGRTPHQVAEEISQA